MIDCEAKHRLRRLKEPPELPCHLEQHVRVALRRDLAGQFNHIAYGTFAGGDIEDKQASSQLEMILIEPMAHIFSVLEDVAQMALAIELRGT